METTTTPRQARSFRTQERILDAVERLLNADPYGELSMPGIAAEAGVSVGGLYGRFTNREKLLEAVHARYQDRRDAMLSSRLEVAATGDLDQRLGAFVDAFVDLHSQNAGVLRSFIIRHWLSAERPTGAVVREVRDHKSRIIEFLLNGLPQADRKRRSDAVRRAVEYVISISKDQIIVSPDTPGERDSLDLEALRRDLRVIARTMILGADPMES